MTLSSGQQEVIEMWTPFQGCLCWKEHMSGHQRPDFRLRGCPLTAEEVRHASWRDPILSKILSYSLRGGLSRWPLIAPLPREVGSALGGGWLLAAGRTRGNSRRKSPGGVS